MNDDTFEKWWSRITAIAVFVVLTGFVVLDFFPEERIDDQVPFAAWAGYTAAFLTWMARRRGSDDEKP